MTYEWFAVESARCGTLSAPWKEALRRRSCTIFTDDTTGSACFTGSFDIDASLQSVIDLLRTNEKRCIWDHFFLDSITNIKGHFSDMMVSMKLRSLTPFKENNVAILQSFRRAKKTQALILETATQELNGNLYWLFAVHIDSISDESCKIGLSYTFQTTTVLPDLITQSRNQTSIATFIAEKFQPAVSRLRFAIGRMKAEEEEESPFNSGALPQAIEINMMTSVGFRWRVGEKVIGKGSFGKVFQGLNEDTGEIIAVKVFKPTNPARATSDEIRAIEREVSAMQHIRHPNIVQYLGVESRNGYVCILMEYVAEGSLDHILAKFGPLSEKLTSSYTRQILLALTHLHAQNMYHRDIKAGNILLAPDNVVKLADFGGARRTLAAEKHQMRSLVGTSRMMAPEVITGNKRGYDGGKADVWSLGCCVIEMATGEPPWQHCKDNDAVMYWVANLGEAPDLPKTLTALTRDFVSRCLEVSPVERPTCEELLMHPLPKLSESKTHDAAETETYGMTVSSISEPDNNDSHNALGLSGLSGKQRSEYEVFMNDPGNAGTHHLYENFQSKSSILSSSHSPFSLPREPPTPQSQQRDSPALFPIPAGPSALYSLPKEPPPPFSLPKEPPPAYVFPREPPDPGVLPREPPPAGVFPRDPSPPSTVPRDPSPSPFNRFQKPPSPLQRLAATGLAAQQRVAASPISRESPRSTPSDSRRLHRRNSLSGDSASSAAEASIVNFTPRHPPRESPSPSTRKHPLPVHPPLTTSPKNMNQKLNTSPRAKHSSIQNFFNLGDNDMVSLSDILAGELNPSAPQLMPAPVRRQQSRTSHQSRDGGTYGSPSNSIHHSSQTSSPTNPPQPLADHISPSSAQTINFVANFPSHVDSRSGTVVVPTPVRRTGSAASNGPTTPPGRLSHQSRTSSTGSVSPTHNGVIPSRKSPSTESGSPRSQTASNRHSSADSTPSGTSKTTPPTLMLRNTPIEEVSSPTPHLSIHLHRRDRSAHESVESSPVSGPLPEEHKSPRHDLNDSPHTSDSDLPTSTAGSVELNGHFQRSPTHSNASSPKDGTPSFSSMSSQLFVMNLQIPDPQPPPRLDLIRKRPQLGGRPTGMIPPTPLSPVISEGGVDHSGAMSQLVSASGLTDSHSSTHSPPKVAAIEYDLSAVEALLAIADLAARSADARHADASRLLLSLPAIADLSLPAFPDMFIKNATAVLLSTSQPLVVADPSWFYAVILRGEVLLSYRLGDLTYRRRAMAGDCIPFVFLLKSGECSVSRTEVGMESCLGFIRLSSAEEKVEMNQLHQSLSRSLITTANFIKTTLCPAISYEAVMTLSRHCFQRNYQPGEFVVDSSNPTSVSNAPRDFLFLVRSGCGEVEQWTAESPGTSRDKLITKSTMVTRNDAIGLALHTTTPKSATINLRVIATTALVIALIPLSLVSPHVPADSLEKALSVARIAAESKRDAQEWREFQTIAVQSIMTD